MAEGKEVIRFTREGKPVFTNPHKDVMDIYDKYDKKAKELGFYGEIKFIKEHSKIMVYVVVN